MLASERLVCTWIDPQEIQAWPPAGLAELLERSGLDYVTFLDRLAAQLVAHDPGFGAQREVCLAAYLHPHNFDPPLEAERLERLSAMLETRELLDFQCFERWAPLVVLKATTLATETYLHERGAHVTPWVDGLIAAHS